MVMGEQNEMVLCNCPNHLVVGITILNGDLEDISPKPAHKLLPQMGNFAMVNYTKLKNTRGENWSKILTLYDITKNLINVCVLHSINVQVNELQGGDYSHRPLALSTTTATTPLAPPLLPSCPLLLQTILTRILLARNDLNAQCRLLP